MIKKLAKTISCFHIKKKKKQTNKQTEVTDMLTFILLFVISVTEREKKVIFFK